MGGPPAGARRASGVPGPPGPHRRRAVRRQPVRRRAQRVRPADHRHRPAPARGHREPEPAHRRDRGGRLRDRGAVGGGVATVPDRLPGRRRRRDGSPAPPLPRSAARADAAQPAAPRRGQLGHPWGDGASGLRRDRDADARALHPRGRSRVPRPVPPVAGLVLRAAPVAAAVQAAAHGRRRGPLLPDRPLPARRGPAGRPAVRVHAARRRDELRGPGRRAGRHQRGGARRRRGRHRRAAGRDPSHHLARGHGPLRRGQARPPLRHGAGGAHGRVRFHRVQGLRRCRLHQGDSPGGRRRGVRPQQAGRPHGPGEAARRQGPRLVQGRRGGLARGARHEVPDRRRAGRPVEHASTPSPATCC